ncbi:MAG: hypothetical protein HDS32_06060 [Bacteroides sp.]|nr:hypothetical protein [Bacteroides sp.]
MNNKNEVTHFTTAGSGSVVIATVAAIAMIAATAMLMPSLRPEAEFGICFPFPSNWCPQDLQILINSLLIGCAVVMAFFMNKKHSFVRSTESILPVAMTVILASNPVNTSYLGTPVFMLIVNLMCLDIMMKSYHSENATTSMFAVATYLSIGSMLQYSFIPLLLVYPVMGIMIKAFRFKELTAYLMGIVAPYWVAFGFGMISLSDFNMPRFLVNMPATDGDYLLFVFISLATLGLVGLMTTLNNAMLTYSGSMRVRSINTMINFLGLACFICMIVDFDNFGAYASTFCFTSSVQISNFFAMRHIPYSDVWFWSLLSVFLLYFIMMIISCLT